MTDHLLQPEIKTALDSMKQKVKDKDKDLVCLVTGEEGDGKSSLALLMADYVDDDFKVSRQVCMDHKDFIRSADKLDKYQSLVFDEGIQALLSRNHGRARNKMMIEWFREARAKNLFIFICMPKFKEIEKPVRDGRAHNLVQVQKQGWAHFFSRDKMNKIEIDRRGNRVLADFPDPSFRAGWKDPSDTDLYQSYKPMKTKNVKNLSGKYLDEGGGSESENRDSELLKFSEAAKIATIGERALRKKETQGKLKALKVNGAKKTSRRELDRLGLLVKEG